PPTGTTTSCCATPPTWPAAAATGPTSRSRRACEIAEPARAGPPGPGGERTGRRSPAARPRRNFGVRAGARRRGEVVEAAAHRRGAPALGGPGRPAREDLRAGEAEAHRHARGPAEKAVRLRAGHDVRQARRPQGGRVPDRGSRGGALYAPEGAGADGARHEAGAPPGPAREARPHAGE